MTTAYEAENARAMDLGVMRDEMQSESDRLIWKTKEEFGFDNTRLAAYINWLRSNIQSRDNDIEEIKRRAKLDAREERDNEIRDLVMSFPEGCDNGKVQFLKHCDIDPPTKRIKLTFYVNVPGDDDPYSWQRDVENYIDACEGTEYCTGDYEQTGWTNNVEGY